jgi:4-hydroxy-tetrahydrodipicolinate synthase
MMPLAHNELRGSFPPLVTPFRDGRVDLETYESLVDYQIQSGSHGIVVAGTTGEPALLTLDERKALAATAVSAAAGRVPVMVATGAPSLADTVELTAHADDIDAAALLVVTPAFTRPPQRGLVGFYEAVCSYTRKPVLMYHIPGRSATTATVDTLEAIAERCDNFVGAKHASTDLGWVTEVLLRLGTDFRIFVGLEELSLPMLAVGASGMVNAVSNVFPAAIAALYQAVQDEKLTEARRLHQSLWELSKSVFFDTNPIPIKYMMRRRGLLPSNEERLPMAAATPDVERRCDQVLAAVAGL